jgi:hypothetical protein
VLFKVKTGRWRGAVYSDSDPEAEPKEWLVVGGIRDVNFADDRRVWSYLFL